MGTLAQAVMPQNHPELIDADGLSPMQRAFIEAYPRLGTISAAANAIGLRRQTVADWLRLYGPETPFASAFAQAKEEAADMLVGESIRRAMTGESRMADALLMFNIKEARPSFRENYTVTSRIEGTINHVVTQLDTNDRQALLQMALEHERRLIAPQGTDDPDIIEHEG